MNEWKPRRANAAEMASTAAVSEAQRIADDIHSAVPTYKLCQEAADELRRLAQVETAWREWLDKTEWVQTSSNAGELGMHRADVLRQRIENLEAENARMRSELERPMSSEATLLVHDNARLRAEVQALRGAVRDGLIDALKEASEHLSDTARSPLADELLGFALMLESAPQPAQEDAE
jgi:NAD(P)H-dependent flavin oxidoreductase YrpB (nitropropane dioxygenase family)